MNGFYIGPLELNTIDKTDCAKLDYSFNWTDWLAQVNETIVDYTLTVPAGLNKIAEQQVDDTIAVLIDGGTIGESYIIECEIETASFRECRSIAIHIVPYR